MICIEWVEGLTVGATYTEVTKASGHLNVCVTNDEGEYQDVDRNCLISEACTQLFHGEEA